MVHGYAMTNISVINAQNSIKVLQYRVLCETINKTELPRVKR